MADDSPGDVTRHLAAWTAGVEGDAAFFESVQFELEKLARSVLATHIRARRRLEPVELVSELYIRLHGRREDLSFANRLPFYAYVLQTMRRILLDEAKRGGKSRPRTAQLLTIGAADRNGDDGRTVDAYDFYRVLDRLREKNPRQATAIELHYIAGWPLNASADALGISTATLKRQLASARQWFEVQLRSTGSEPDA